MLLGVTGCPVADTPTYIALDLEAVLLQNVLEVEVEGVELLRLIVANARVKLLVSLLDIRSERCEFQDASDLFHEVLIVSLYLTHRGILLHILALLFHFLLA